MNTPKIYIACLAAYNAGKLHGQWIDANQTPEALQEAVNAILASSPEAGAEECAIHDFEGFEGVEIKEYQSLETISKIAEALEEYPASFAAFLRYTGDIDRAIENFEGAFLGLYDSKEDYAMELIEQMTTKDTPEMFTRYFDYEAFARDLELNGEVTFEEVDGKIAVFDTINY